MKETVQSTELRVRLRLKIFRFRVVLLMQVRSTELLKVISEQSVRSVKSGFVVVGRLRSLTQKRLLSVTTISTSAP